MLVLILLSCSDYVLAPQHPEPSFVRVEITAGEAGTRESPLAFSSDARTWSVKVTTEDREGEPYAFNGELTVDVRPGRLEQTTNLVTVVDGVYEGEVTFEAAYGPTRIWFSDEGDRPGTTEREPTYATGVSEPIWIELPTIAEINIIDDPTTNQLAGEFAEVRSADRDLRVTSVGTNGYWVADLDDGVAAYNAMFVYTFSAPNPWVELGQRITSLNGSDQDYLGTTQLSFPHYTVGDEEPVAVPEAVELTEALCGDDDALEAYESALVRLEDVWLPSSFTPGTQDYDDYIDYGQWPVAFGQGGGSCVFYADSTIAVPSFDPTEHAGEALTSVTGMLFQVFDKWILLIRSVEDLPIAFELEGTGAGPPRPAPRKDPREERTVR